MYYVANTFLTTTKLSRDSRCTELGDVTEAGKRSALTVCSGVDQTLIDLTSLTGHVDHHEPLTRPLYTSNTSDPLSITLTMPTYDDVAYLLLYEGLITAFGCTDISVTDFKC